MRAALNWSVALADPVFAATEQLRALFSAVPAGCVFVGDDARRPSFSLLQAERLKAGYFGEQGPRERKQLQVRFADDARQLVQLPPVVIFLFIFVFRVLESGPTRSGEGLFPDFRAGSPPLP